MRKKVKKEKKVEREKKRKKNIYSAPTQRAGLHAGMGTALLNELDNLNGGTIKSELVRWQGEKRFHI